MKRAWVVFNQSDGSMLFRNQSTDGEDHNLEMVDGQDVIEVPPDVNPSDPLFLDAVKSFHADRVEAMAEAIRSTDTPSKVAVHLRKEMEARAYLADSSSKTPMLSVEAKALKITVKALASQVAKAADVWVAREAKIEAYRRSAPVVIASASNLAEISAAMDWKDLNEA